MHRFIPSRLQLSYPSSRPWFTEACGEAVVLKQFVFASWKANPSEGNLSSFHKVQNKCVSTHRRARKQHLSHLKSELSNLSPSSKYRWHLIKSVAGVCSPLIPSLTLNGRTADNAHEKAECLNSVFAAKSWPTCGVVQLLGRLPARVLRYIDIRRFTLFRAGRMRTGLW